jgi:hypothetical protein
VSVWDFSRCLFGISAASAILAGCGKSQSLPGAAPVAGPAASALKHSHTFNFTETEQTFEVPQGVTAITVDAYGGGTHSGRDKRRALGGRTKATLPVTPGETLYVFVGGGGFNGGGRDGCSGQGPSGAGASDVRERGDGLGNRILVAGGAGGLGARQDNRHGGHEGLVGGNGGGLIGGSGRGGGGTSGHAGTGGTQSAGGAGGAGGKNGGSPGNSGAVGVGGGGGGVQSVDITFCGGGGGGGYYGGGGGGSSSKYGSPGGSGLDGGGGGGSSYTEPSATNVTLTQGSKTATGNGSVVVSW